MSTCAYMYRSSHVYMRTLRAAPLFGLPSTIRILSRPLPTASSSLTTTSFIVAPPRSFTSSRKLANMDPNMTAIFSKDAAPAAGPYSHAIKTPTAIYCSGQIPADADGNLVEGDIGVKTAACIKNLQAILQAAGSDLNKIVKCNIFLTDMSNFAPMNEEYSKWLAHKPARSCVAVKTLPKNVEVEIEAIALP